MSECNELAIKKTKGLEQRESGQQKMNRAFRVIAAFLFIIVGIYFPLAYPLCGLAEGTAMAQDGITNMYYPEALDSFWAKVNAIEEIGRRARETGQAIEFREIFSEDEINAALTGLVDSYSDQLIQLKDIKVFLRDESVYGVSSCTILGMELSVSAIPDIWLESGKPRIRIKSLDIQGAPSFIDGFITGIINRRIDVEYNRIQQKYDYFEISSIIFESKQVTIAGLVK